MTNKRVVYVRNGSTTYEVNPKGIDVKSGDLVVFFYNNQYQLGKVVEKSVGEVQITENEGYILNLVKNNYLELQRQKADTWKSMCRIREILKDMYISKLETNDETIDLEKVSKEYLKLKEDLKEIEAKLSYWESL